MLDATLVAIAEHGLVPSVQAARMTLAAAPEALQGAVAAGLLGCGSVILGASEAAGRLLDEVLAEGNARDGLEDAARVVVGRHRAARKAIPGYGHPLHKQKDPRAVRLLDVADEVGVTGRYTAAAHAIERILPEIVGKPLVMNISCAIPCVLLDAGYPLLALRGVPLLARAASLVGHLLEEQQQPIGFQMSQAGAARPSATPARHRTASSKARIEPVFGVLNGVRVVEQGTFITGPCCGMMLADLGADVIKVETPGEGDPYRSFRNGFYSAHFQAYNRNKRSLCLDLKAGADIATFHDLIRHADVYIQNFRPGVAARIGADYATLAALNPHLVYCSISGFGPDGPYAKRPVYDSVAQAVSGFLGVAIDRDNPRFLGPALADPITGIYASLAIAGALVERGRTGKGRHVELSMFEAMMHFAVEPFMGFFALGEIPTGADRPRLAQAFIVRCRDDKLLAFHLSSLEKFWVALVAVTETPDLASDPRFCTRLLRIDNHSALSAELNAIFARHDRADWLARLAGADLPFAPIATIDEVVEDPQADHLDMIVPVSDRHEGAARTVRPPFTFDGARASHVGAAPLLDQHGPDIRAQIAAEPEAWPGAYAARAPL